MTFELFAYGDIPEERQVRNPSIKTTRVVVAGEYKAGPKDAWSGMNTYKARLSEAITDIREIELFEKLSMPFSRFFLVGFVEYEDLFGFGYEGGFALKVFPNLMQGIRGGEAFNYYRYKKKMAPS